MALLAEELVEEWLNRDGYFPSARQDCGHGLICLPSAHHANRVPPPLRSPCRAADCLRHVRAPRSRSPHEIRETVAAGIAKKYDATTELKHRFAPYLDRELVVGRIKYPEELEEPTQQASRS